MPPAGALLHCISSSLLWRIFCQTGTFRGVFSPYKSFITLEGSAQLRWQGTLYFLSSLVQWEITRGPNSGPTVIYREVFSIHYSPGSEAAMGWAEVGGHNMINMTIRELHCTFADFSTKLEFSRGLYIILITPKGTAAMGRVGSGEHYILIAH